MNEYDEHSKKICWCGGHNHTNAKKNKNHNSTKSKYVVQQTRKQLKRIVDVWFQ